MKAIEVAQQAWVQGMISHRVVSVKEAQEMHKAAILALGVPYDQRQFADFYSAVGRLLSRVGLEIRRSRDEKNGVEMMMIVNANGDETAQLATQFSSVEISFIKALIQAIFTAPNHAYSVSKLDALDLGQDILPAQFTNSKVEALCDRLVRQGWLRKEPAHYSLSPRSLVELQTYLRAAFEDYVHPCIICKDMVTMGLACTSPNCSAWVHDICSTAYVGDLEQGRGQGDRLCKECGRTWDPTKIGDRQATEVLVRRRGRPAGTSHGIRRHFQSQGGDVDDMIESDEEETTSTASTSKRRRTSRQQDQEEHKDKDDDRTSRVSDEEVDELEGSSYDN